MASTSFIEIVDYWSTHEDECGLAVDWSEAHERCWRCAYVSRLEKCHIVPRSLGGTERANNLVLLCSRCHREAPNHDNPKYMWIWLRATCVPFYDTYWTNRGLEEFKTMFGRLPFDWATKSGIDTESIVSDYAATLDEEIKRSIIHFGEGRLNPSSIASITAEVEQRIADKHNVILEASAREYSGQRFNKSTTCK